jgi:hypothetical protein
MDTSAEAGYVKFLQEQCSAPRGAREEARQALTKAMHGYYSADKAKERGCLVYARQDGTTVFVTDLLDHVADDDCGEFLGGHVGLLTHYVRAWECGRLLMDGKTENDRVVAVPSVGDRAVEFIDRVRKPDQEMVPALMPPADVQDPFDSTAMFEQYIRKRKRCE